MQGRRAFLFGSFPTADGRCRTGCCTPPHWLFAVSVFVSTGAATAPRWGAQSLGRRLGGSCHYLRLASTDRRPSSDAVSDLAGMAATFSPSTGLIVGEAMRPIAGPP